jgi:hypothetical protein
VPDVAGAGGAPDVAGAGGVPDVAGAGGAVVAGAGGVPDVAGAGGAVVAGAGGAVVAGAGGGESPGAGGGESPGAGGDDSPGAGAGAVRDGVTVLLGATGATTPDEAGAGVGIVTISPGVGCVGETGVASAVCAGLAGAPGKPCRCTDVSVTRGVGGGRSVGSAGPGAVDWPSCGPINVGSGACWAHAPAVLAITAAASAARRAMGVMRCSSASRMPAPGAHNALR